MKEESADDPLSMRIALVAIWFYNNPTTSTIDAAEVFGVARGVIFKDLQYFRNPGNRPKTRRNRRLTF
ncbi:MAG: hypothetical protein LBK52_01005 [Deltaproteobacteria bacterium]|nr:hypothetical protein [Deltaproteobacteria bacterium]